MGGRSQHTTPDAATDLLALCSWACPPENYTRVLGMSWQHCDADEKSGNAASRKVPLLKILAASPC